MVRVLVLVSCALSFLSGGVSMILTLPLDLCVCSSCPFFNQVMVGGGKPSALQTNMASSFSLTDSEWPAVVSKVGSAVEDMIKCSTGTHSLILSLTSDNHLHCSFTRPHSIINCDAVVSSITHTSTSDSDGKSVS